jgi:circadian clock protein KaiC
MSDPRKKVPIERLPSGVSKLDDILGGGWPEYSFNVVVGEPGSGKTTLAHQFMFANASPERKAVYFTVLGEPTIKMLRYQQQFTFFDMAKVNGEIHFANLTDEALSNDLGQVLQRLSPRSRNCRPGSSSSIRSERWPAGAVLAAPWICRSSCNAWRRS